MCRRTRPGPILATVVAACALCGWPAQGEAPPLPELKVGKDAPLLLDDAPGPAPGGDAPAEAPRADLQVICYDCHGTFKEEPLALTHAREGVTCMKCHGASDAHANDEGNITPPEVMYPRDRIGAKCLECHETHDAPAAEVVARWKERGLEKLRPGDLVCTDCHGEHRMNVRTIHWDKKTGRLLPGPKTSRP